MDRTARVVDHVMMALAVVTGVGSIGLFAWDARPAFVTMGWPPRVALLWDALLSLLFFVQHSGMVRRSFRARLSRVIPARFDVALYAIVSGVALTLVLVLWQQVPTPVFELRGAARVVAVTCSLAGVALLLISGYAVRRTLDLLGLRPIRAHLRGQLGRPSPFFVEGPYRWVRHPLYACILLLFWARPEWTADDLLFATLWSAWIVVGTVLEERDLVADFGEVYRSYQRKVPMLVPWRGRVRFG